MSTTTPGQSWWESNSDEGKLRTFWEFQDCSLTIAWGLTQRISLWIVIKLNQGRRTGLSLLID